MTARGTVSELHVLFGGCSDWLLPHRFDKLSTNWGGVQSSLDPNVCSFDITSRIPVLPQVSWHPAGFMALSSCFDLLSAREVISLKLSVFLCPLSSHYLWKTREIPWLQEGVKRLAKKIAKKIGIETAIGGTTEAGTTSGATVTIVTIKVRIDVTTAAVVIVTATTTATATAIATATATATGGR